MAELCSASLLIGRLESLTGVTILKGASCKWWLRRTLAWLIYTTLFITPFDMITSLLSFITESIARGHHDAYTSIRNLLGINYNWSRHFQLEIGNNSRMNWEQIKEPFYFMAMGGPGMFFTWIDFSSRMT